MQVVENGAFALAIGASQRHEFGIAGKTFQVEGQHIQAEAIADTAKAFQGQREGIHGIGLQGSEPSACPLFNVVQGPSFATVFESAVDLEPQSQTAHGGIATCSPGAGGEPAPPLLPERYIVLSQKTFFILE